MKVSAFTPLRTAYQPQKATKTEPTPPLAPTPPNQRSGGTLVVRNPNPTLPNMVRELAGEARKLNPHVNPLDNLIYLKNTVNPNQKIALTPYLKIPFWNQEMFWPEVLQTQRQDAEKVRKDCEKLISPTESDLNIATHYMLKQMLRYSLDSSM
jgi:hypothetical protein